MYQHHDCDQAIKEDRTADACEGCQDPLGQRVRLDQANCVFAAGRVFLGQVRRSRRHPALWEFLIGEEAPSPRLFPTRREAVAALYATCMHG